MRGSLKALVAVFAIATIGGCEAAERREPVVATVASTSLSDPADVRLQRSDDSESVTLPLSPSRTDSIYPWVERIESAPTVWFDEERADGSAGERWRAVVTRSEIYVALSLEQLSVGPEGCCMRLAEAWHVDLDSIARYFGLRGETSQLTNLVASGDRSFGFQLTGLPLSLELVGRDSVRVRRAP